tara:strand:- start:4297 stop:4635 length:339 start_codon:yes stop_codon:yes gene_type:complete
VRFEREGVHFVSLSKGINTTTPGGKLVFSHFQRRGRVSPRYHRGEYDRRDRSGKAAGCDAGTAKSSEHRHDIAEAHREITQGHVSPQDIADRYDVHLRTVTRALERAGLVAA